MQKKPKIGDNIGGGRTYVGQATKRNLLQAAKGILIDNTKILDSAYRSNGFLFLHVSKGKYHSFVALQNIGGLTYCGDIGCDEAKRQLSKKHPFFIPDC